MPELPRLVVITGMSGAGRSQAAKFLEDLGYGVVDNLPPEFITDVVAHVDLDQRPRARLAVVVDTRRGLTFEELEDALRQLSASGVHTTVLFLDADDQTLLDRYSENRRPHPVAAPSLSESIALERKALEELRGEADIVIDTTARTVPELHKMLEDAFAADRRERSMQISVVSFGFKRGLPRTLDLLFDVRFLPNPYWVPELQTLTGHDPAVRDYVLGSEDAAQFIDRAHGLLSFLVPRYMAEGKAYLTIGIGCTGGQHRSVVIADEVTKRLREEGFDVSVSDRDVAE